MSRVALPLLLILAFPSVSPQPSAAALAQDERAGFHAVIDPVIDALWTGFDQPTAFEHVQFISQFWRLPGNTATTSRSIASASALDVRRIRARRRRLRAASVGVEEYPNQGGPGSTRSGPWRWSRTGKPDEIVLSRRSGAARALHQLLLDRPGRRRRPAGGRGAGTRRGLRRQGR